MSSRQFPAAPLIAITAASLLASACVSITPVKEITADPTGYMHKQFDPALLPPAIAKQLPANPPLTGFSQLSFQQETRSESSDGKTETWQSKLLLKNVGNGLVQRLLENSNNGIPYLFYYSLTHKGMFSLKWQEVALQRPSSGLMFEVKEITRLDPMPETEKQTFTVDFTSGSANQLANFNAFTRTCQTLHTYPASDIHSAIPGKALAIECQHIANNLPQSRTQWALLQHYGVALQTGFISSSKKLTIRVTGFESRE